MTPEQIEICLKFGNVRFLPGSFDKRFAYNVHAIASRTPDKQLSDSQNEWMFRLLYKYRKQLPVTYEKHKNNPMCGQKPKVDKSKPSTPLDL
jgi:hypothetical protein